MGNTLKIQTPQNTENCIRVTPGDNVGPLLKVCQPYGEPRLVAPSHTPYLKLSGMTGEAFMKIFTSEDPPRVWLSDKVNLDQVKGLELQHLLAVREIINTAIYDKQNHR